MAHLSTQLGYPTTNDELRRRLLPLLANADHLLLVAEQQPAAEVVAWVHTFMVRAIEMDSFAEVVGLVVEERHRGRGVGEQLMHAVEEWAHRLRLSHVRVRSNVIRTRAHVFYQRLGYEYVKQQMVFRKSF